MNCPMEARAARLRRLRSAFSREGAGVEWLYVSSVMGCSERHVRRLAAEPETQFLITEMPRDNRFTAWQDCARRIGHYGAGRRRLYIPLEERFVGSTLGTTTPAVWRRLCRNRIGHRRPSVRGHLLAETCNQAERMKVDLPQWIDLVNKTRMPGTGCRRQNQQEEIDKILKNPTEGYGIEDQNKRRNVVKNMNELRGAGNQAGAASFFDTAALRLQKFVALSTSEDSGPMEDKRLDPMVDWLLGRIVRWEVDRATT